MDRLTSMRVFTSVVENSGFSAASEKLGLSRAAVSKHIAQLEMHLGGRLLNRTTRRMSLTGVGRVYYTSCKQILEDIDAAECVVSGLSNAPRGVLRINAPMSFGSRRIAPLLARFNTLYPAVEVDLSLNDRLVDVVEEGYDLVIRIAELADSNLIARRLAPSHQLLCASPGYLQAHGIPQHPQDLARHACLRYSYSRHTDEWLLQGPAGEQRVRISGPLRSNNGDALCCAAEQGQGIALLPTFIAGDAIRAGRLQCVLPEYRPPVTGIHAIYPSSRHLSAKVRAFIDFLAGEIEDPPCWDSDIIPGPGGKSGT